TANVNEGAASRAAALQRQLANATAKVAQEVQIVVNSADAVIYGTPAGRNAFLVRLNGVWQYNRIDAYDANGAWVAGTTETPQGVGSISTQADPTGASRADRQPFVLSRQQPLGTTTYTYGGVPLLAAYAQVPSTPRIHGLDWSLIVEEPANQVLGLVDTLRTA